MRTTLTLDPDVAAQVERLRKRSRQSLKEVVNTVMRAGFQAIARDDLDREGPYRTRSVSLGGSLVGDIDNVNEVLSLVEGDGRA